MHKNDQHDRNILALLRMAPPITGETIGNEAILDLLKEMYGENSISLIRFNRRRHKTRASGTLDVYDLTHTIVFVLPRTLATLILKRFTHFYFVPSSNRLGLTVDILILIIARLTGVKPIAHSRSGAFTRSFEENNITKIEETFLKLVHKVIFLSYELSLPAKRIDEEKCSVIFNTIDEAVMPHAPVQRDSNKISVLFAGNFYESKGYIDLLDSLELISQEHKDRFSFTFCGLWPMSELDKQQNFLVEVERLKTNYDIRYLGPITDRAQLSKIYSQSDFLCLPTYYPVEAQPRSIIEAMSHGLGIITTAHASIPEMLNGANFVKWVKAKSPEQIASAVESILTVGSLDQTRRDSIAHYLKYFSRESARKKLEYIFL
ncbi:MAG: glycosyltransferase [Pseudomonadota bacterium]|nr:glycosyltransferase [Pseudomonadota bacterium]